MMSTDAQIKAAGHRGYQNGYRAGKKKRPPDARSEADSIARYDALNAQRAEIERLRDSLDRVANPLHHLQKDAVRDGVRLDGTAAVRLSDDPAHLRAIAKSALEDGGKYYAGQPSVKGSDRNG